MPAGGTYDVVVVGARCAGSPLAAYLARAGVKVAVVDRTAFPSDTVSTHTFQKGAIASLDRLGVLDRVRKAGAPRIRRAISVLDDGVDLSTPVEDQAGGLESLTSVRRITLDEILVDEARESGAEMHLSTKVRSLIKEGDRVVGVRVEGPDGAERDLRARLVVGADGVSSTVASQVGSRRYNLIHNHRFYQYAYYEGVHIPSPTTILFHRANYELAFASPCDGDLVIVTVGPHFEDLPQWRRDPGAGFDAEVAKMPIIADFVATGRRVTKPRGVVKATSYFRESAGSGWVLVGDAGHFKDPTPGQGIADALRGAERLAKEIQAGLGEGDAGLDRRMRDYWRWRDRVSWQRHWWASELALPGKVSPISLEVLRRLSATPGGALRWWQIFLQERQPREVLRPMDATLATVALLRRRGVDPAEVMADSRRLAREEIVHNWLQRRPRFETRADTAAYETAAV